MLALELIVSEPLLTRGLLIRLHSTCTTSKAFAKIRLRNYYDRRV